MRKTSVNLFRDRYMLEVCLAVRAAQDRVNLTDLASSAGLSASLYSGPVHRLRALGLLVDAHREGDDYRVRWYDVKDSQLWDAVAEFER